MLERSIRKGAWLLAVVALVAAAGIAGCGDDDGGDDSAKAAAALSESSSDNETLTSRQLVRQLSRPAAGSSTEALPYTTEQVLDLFRKDGAELVNTLGPAVTSFALIKPDDDADDAEKLEIYRKYGLFSIWVAHKQGLVADLLLDRQGNKIEPDADGIYWEEGHVYLAWSEDFETVWSASRRYENVVVNWYGGDEKKTDETWDRLNAVLERLPSAG